MKASENEFSLMQNANFKGYRIEDLFRLNEWWNSQVPRDLAFIILIVLLNHLNPLEKIKTCVLLLISIIGFRAFTYFINDWTDIEQDKKARKHNFVAKNTTTFRITAFILLLCLALLPWCFFAVTKTAYILLATEIFLILLYSVRPFRLKEKGGIGIISDALYALVIPFMIYWCVIGYKFDFSLIIPICILLFVSGIRRILLHQVIDYNQDILSHTNTLSVKIGLKKTFSLLNFIIPFEVIIFLGLGVYLNRYIPYLGVFIAISIFFRIFFSQYGENILMHSYSIIRLNFRLNNLIDKDLPLVLFSYLVFIDWRFIGLLICYLAFFGRHYFFSAYAFPEIKYKVAQPIYLKLRYRTMPHIYFNVFLGFYHRVLKWGYYNILTKLWGTIKLIVNYAIYYLFIVPYKRVESFFKKDNRFLNANTKHRDK